MVIQAGARWDFDIRAVDRLPVFGCWVLFAAVALYGMVLFLALGAVVGSPAPSPKVADIIIWCAFLPMLWFMEVKEWRVTAESAPSTST